MSGFLVYVGVAIMVVGVVLAAIEYFRKPEPVAQEAVDPAKVLEEIRKLLDGVEQRFRLPLMIMFFGLALAILGVYLELSETKEAAEQVATVVI